jgi:Family of unknown function (DUF6152)
MILMGHKFRGVLMGVLGLFATVPAFAHHGYATEFDVNKCTVLKGTLSGVEWENPHAFFHIDVKDGDGKVNTWRLETISPNSLKRSGTTREDVLNNVGKPAVARICPTKAGGTPYKGTAEFFKLGDGVLRIVGQNIENLPPEQVNFDN